MEIKSILHFAPDIEPCESAPRSPQYYAGIIADKKAADEKRKKTAIAIIKLGAKA